MELKAVVFDLDGTLVDTIPDVHIALNSMLATYGLKGIERSAIYSLIGNGAKAMVKKAFSLNEQNLNESDAEAATKIYLNYYRAKPVVETKIYPGVVPILKQFIKAKIKLAICTNKPGVMANIVLQRLNLNNYFEIIVAGDEVKKPKPHADHINIILENMKVKPEAAAMVGDSDIDLQCAQNAGIEFVGVSYGYQSDKLKSAKVIDHFIELPNVLKVSI